MYFDCDCSLQRLKRSHSGSHKRLSASVAQRKAFSPCCAAQGFQPVQSHGVVPSLSLVPSTSVPRMQASLTSTRSTASWPSEGFADSATEVS